ncbi:MAG: DUF3426 domain-containing protein [Lautropia sp.]|nr:DUF3426 domain-containing protein [Lautropia sp.]
MALATTCPQCKTSFKVVPDQLKLRRGLVRCGVCQHVFSGVEHLRYVDKDEKTEKATPAAGMPSAPVTAIDAPTPTAAPPVSPQGPDITAGTAQAVDANAPAGQGAVHDRLPPEQVLSVTEVPDLSMPGEAAETDHVAADGEEAHANTGATPPRPADTDNAHDASHHADSQASSHGANHGASSQPESGQDEPQPRNSREKRRWRRERERERARQAAAAPAPVDDEVHTQFFMADHEELSGSANAPDSSRLPASLRQDASKARHGQEDLDPDTLAAGALIDEANKIWQQHQPRQTQPSGTQATEAHDTDKHEDTTPASPAAVLETATDEPVPAAALPQTGDSTDTPLKARNKWLTPTRARRLIIALAVLAIIQLLAVFRTEIAYHLPFLRPLASAASTLTGQTIEPPMALGSLSIESFELRSTQQPGQTRLTAILRNRSELPARWPAMELTLTGPSNAVLVRKVMTPAHYLPVTRSIQDGIPAKSEQPLDLLLDTGELNLAGYAASLFYP